MKFKVVPSLFGALLRDYRNRMGWSQTELARQLGMKYGYKISPSAINKYELGKRRPGGAFIYYLEKDFDLSEEEVEAFFAALSNDYVEELYDAYYTTMGNIDLD